MNILFFEDEPDTSLTRTFIKELATYFGNRIELYPAYRVEAFERIIRDTHIDYFILDIMTVDENLVGLISKQFVPHSQTGIELLTRLRKGYYGDKYISAVVVMRSQVMDFDEFIAECEKQEANGLFVVGTDDDHLIEHLTNHLSTI